MIEPLVEADLYKKTSQELTDLLYQTAIERLEQAVEAIENNQLAEVNQLLQKTSDILYRLGAGINYEAGPLAFQMDAIYNYMVDTLFDANLKKDKKKIEEVISLLKTITEAWNSALKKGPTHEGMDMRKKASAYEQNLSFEDQFMDKSVDRKE